MNQVIESTPHQLDLKERNKEICRLYRDESLSTYEIAKIIDLTQQRVHQILKENIGLLKVEKEWEKVQRVHSLKTFLKDKKESNKDPVEIIEQLRKEIDGDKPLVDQSVNIQQINYVRYDPNNQDPICTSDVPVGDRTISSEV